MMLVPLAVVLLAAFVNAEPAINESGPRTNRPGRFLSLPIPQKCANRKYSDICASFQILFILCLLEIMIMRYDKKISTLKN